MQEIATSADWLNIPFDSPKDIKLYIYFEKEELDKLKVGYIPRVMENKWFAYFESNTLYIHRSWTGFEVYRIEFSCFENGYFSSKFWVESNPEKYSAPEEMEYINFSNFMEFYFPEVRFKLM